LQLLCERFGITSVLIEGGAGVLQSVLEQGLADQAVVTIQPAFLGGYRCLTGQLAQGLVQLSDVAVESVYGDVVLYGRLSANTL
jgi:riboflavin biosynthesis pyrimidine reductase